MINSTYPYNLPPLPYSYNSLEPYIDTETMHLHHDKHFKTYVDNLNKALKNYPALQKITLTKLLLHQDNLPLDVNRNAGGVFNHYLFFEKIGPKKSEPSENLLKLINNQYGSFENFKIEFSNNAKSVFGSGWTFLTFDKNNRLKIVNTKNQETPLKMGLTPIIVFDVWEHAYYLKYKNTRAKYIENLWNAVQFQ